MGISRLSIVSNLSSRFFVPRSTHHPSASWVSQRYWLRTHSHQKWPVSVATTTQKWLGYCKSSKLEVLSSLKQKSPTPRQQLARDTAKNFIRGVSQRRNLRSNFFAVSDGSVPPKLGDIGIKSRYGAVEKLRNPVNRHIMLTNSKSSNYGAIWNKPFGSSFHVAFSDLKKNCVIPGDSESQEPLSDQDVVEQELQYEVDPITNRRVVRNPTDSQLNKKYEGKANETTANTFKGYRSQFADFTPPPSEQENVECNEKFADPVNEHLKVFDEKLNHRFRRLCDAAQMQIDYSDPINKGLKTYDEKISSKPFGYEDKEKWNAGISDQRYPKPSQCLASENASWEQLHRPGNISVEEKGQSRRDPDQEIMDEYKIHIQKEAEAQSQLDSVQKVTKHDNPKAQMQNFPSRVELVDETIQGYRKNKEQLDSTISMPDPYLEASLKRDRLFEKCFSNTENSEFTDENTRHEKQEPVSGAIKQNHEDSIRENMGGMWRIKTDQIKESLEGYDTKASYREINVRDGVSYFDRSINHEATANVDNLGAKEIRAGLSKITGNFARDFPEDFKTSWSQNDDGSGTLVPKSQVEHQAKIEKSDYLSELALKEAFARDPNTPRIETSLDRTVSRIKKSYDESIKNSCAVTPELEKTVKPKIQIQSEKVDDRALLNEVREIYEDVYGVIDSKHRQSLAPANSRTPSLCSRTQTSEATFSSPERTVYKILVYDPTIQAVSEAETTSTVPDSSSALTPTEVLLRLSNPAKFLPHFESLQSQGFEIASGSGDVLVFRKSRSGSATIADRLSNTRKLTRSRRNPIDGMSCPTGDFASPTGFVNYDIYRGSEVPFKSNIDVRREEPVFSGKKNWDDVETNHRRRERFKRLAIGAAWLGACSYAVGVVADYFTNGGVDGLGPAGL